MDLAATTSGATIPDWITAISTAVLALSVVAAGIRWTRQQAKELTDPGEPPDERLGEFKEGLEDTLRDHRGSRSVRRWARRKVRKDQRGLPLRVRWQRHLRRRERRREARKRMEAYEEELALEQQSQELRPVADIEDETDNSGD